ncbi:MAG: enoyl-CoA hydratase/isomerase family protein [Gordonia polyisoprenivorans]|nr:enoyl-CoA hydratase/isomerase family protein [Gordonia polyisoprenivorans]
MIGPIRWERDADGVVVLTFDAPGKSANTYDTAFKDAFRDVVTRLADDASVTGVVITSAKRSFFAGGDLTELITARPDDAQRLHADFTATKQTLRRLETLPVPVVAALNGAALGGGFEIALACHHRVAANTQSLRVGLPEVTFGLLPGGGGVARTVRLLGVAAALDSVLLTGAAHGADAALALGLVDEIVPEDEDIVQAAKRCIAGRQITGARWDAADYRMPGDDPTSQASAAAISPRVAGIRSRNRGAPNRAARNIIAAATEGARLEFDTALEIETSYFVDLVISQEAKNRIQGSFLDQQAVRTGAARPVDVPEFRTRRLGVVGAGMMGAGIAYVAAAAGIEVVLQDVSLESADRGKSYADRVLAKQIDRGKTTRDRADDVLARIVTTSDISGVLDCDAVVEAVFENPDLKRDIFEKLAAGDRLALLASNTSTIPISELATGTDRPEDFIGMHFFSPVDRMAPVEIVVGEKTSDTAIARAMDLARQLGKLPLVVNDGRGFFTSRVIGKVLDEALAMLGEGCPAASIEQAAMQAGYPSPPLQLLDETTITLPRTVRREARAAAQAAGQEWVLHPAEPVMDILVDELGRSGRVNGAGFYEYVDGTRRGLWEGLAARFGSRPDQVPFDDMKERLLFSESLEAVRCLEDGVLRSFADANVGSMLAIGYPAWTGGVLQYVDGYPDGVAGFVRRADELAERYGPRFTPPELLRTKAAAGQTLR